MKVYLTYYSVLFVFNIQRTAALRQSFVICIFKGYFSVDTRISEFSTKKLMSPLRSVL